MKIWAKTEEYREGKFLVVRRDGTVPHWPHFVMGARDPCAPVALRAYAKEAEKRNMDPDFVASLFELADDFEEYLVGNGEGDPDAPPHRTDDQGVILAMRGHSTVISVRPDKCNVKK